jgi:hypothetical protein
MRPNYLAPNNSNPLRGALGSLTSRPPTQILPPTDPRGSPGRIPPSHQRNTHHHHSLACPCDTMGMAPPKLSRLVDRTRQVLFREPRPLCQTGEHPQGLEVVSEGHDPIVEYVPSYDPAPSWLTTVASSHCMVSTATEKRHGRQKTASTGSGTSSPKTCHKHAFSAGATTREPMPPTG